jgi:hypothetical protein
MKPRPEPGAEVARFCSDQKVQGKTVVTKIYRFNPLLIFLPAHSNEVPLHNQTVLFLGV